MPKWKPDIEQIMRGSEHKTLEDAIAADLVSGLPIIGTVSNFFRVIDSGTKPKRVLQSLDLISSPFPGLDQLTFSNTILYLNENEMLPIELSEIDKLVEKLLPKTNRRNK